MMDNLGVSMNATTLEAYALAKGLDEGFYNPVREDLNNAAAGSRQAYNVFVREANPE